MDTTTKNKLELSQTQINDLMKATGYSEAETRKAAGEFIDSLPTFI